MSKRMKFKTRDPIVSARDPVPVSSEHARCNIGPVPSVFVPIAKCSCGGTVWREGGTTFAYPETKEMARYRRCSKCNRPVWIRSPMNDRQIAKYCP
jgi:hypothetical protein